VDWTADVTDCRRLHAFGRERGLSVVWVDRCTLLDFEPGLPTGFSVRGFRFACACFDALREPTVEEPEVEGHLADPLTHLGRIAADEPFAREPLPDAGVASQHWPDDRRGDCCVCAVIAWLVVTSADDPCEELLASVLEVQGGVEAVDSLECSADTVSAWLGHLATSFLLLCFLVLDQVFKELVR